MVKHNIFCSTKWAEKVITVMQHMAFSQTTTTRQHKTAAHNRQHTTDNNFTRLTRHNRLKKQITYNIQQVTDNMLIRQTRHKTQQIRGVRQDVTYKKETPHNEVSQ